MRRHRHPPIVIPLSLIAVVLAIVAIAIAHTLSTTSGPTSKFGQKLNDKGEHAYQVAKEEGHEELGSAETETPPPEAAVPIEDAADLLKLNEERANLQTVGPDHPVPLAAKEPVDFSHLLPRNYSSRRGARPALLVVHDTESPNVLGLQDVLAIRAWFSNPTAQASSHYTTDAEGNTIRLVLETEKAWTQAFFNPWSISDELIGHATQTAWPEAQLRATAKLFAAAAAKWGIPVQHARVNGCTIVRAGIIQHSDLGACGGGHHDAGPRFPIDRFIVMVGEYRTGGYRPKTPVKTKPCTTTRLQAALNRGGARLDVDGLAGPKTRAALAAYQARRHLTPAAARKALCAG